MSRSGREATREDKQVRVSIEKALLVELDAAGFTRRARRDPLAPLPRGAAAVPEVLPESSVQIPEQVLLLEKVVVLEPTRSRKRDATATLTQ